MRLPACVARFEDGQAVCPAILRPWHISVVHGFAAITPNPKTPPPLARLAPPVQFTAPELQPLAKVGLIYEGGSVVRGNSPRMPLDLLIMYQVLTGAVHAVRDGFM